MKIRGINFRPIWAMSGALNFFGEGYWYHRILKTFGVRTDGLTFVAKTVTLKPRLGNMPLVKRNLQPRELFPKCIWADPRRKIALNAVGLSNPGIWEMLRLNRWQQREDPDFFLSFMPVDENPDKWVGEAAEYVDILRSHLHSFKAKRFGLQINLTCPNTGHGVKEFVLKAPRILEAFEPLYQLGIVIGVKLSVEVRPEVAVSIGNHPLCEFLHLSNTVPFRALPDKIDWDTYFGKAPLRVKNEGQLGILNWGKYKGPGCSPLVLRGLKQPGGLSGEPLRPLVVDTVRKIYELGYTKPINSGGGILEPKHLDELRPWSEGGYSIGSMFFLHPQAINATVAYAHELSQYAKNHR